MSEYFVNICCWNVISGTLNEIPEQWSILHIPTVPSHVTNTLSKMKKTPSKILCHASHMGPKFQAFYMSRGSHGHLFWKSKRMSCMSHVQNCSMSHMSRMSWVTWVQKSKPFICHACVTHVTGGWVVESLFGQCPNRNNMNFNRASFTHQLFFKASKSLYRATVWNTYWTRHGYLWSH